MFYSHTLLARKTPLGTVWCAAHLQHRLNKKDYEKTKISIVVDAIMFGEVPLALRTSSYLLLGVVRIYSKQVDYLKHDFDVLVTRINSHSSAKLTLPDDARQAPFHSITLPDTFDLDALELDIDIYNEGAPDDHLKGPEEITLADQNFMGRDAYVAISFDEDIMMDLSHHEDVPDVGFKSMEEDILPPPIGSTVNLQHVPSVTEDVLNTRLSEDNIPQSFPGVEVPYTMDAQVFGTGHQSVHNDDNSPHTIPEIEVLRAAVPDFSPTNLTTVPPLGDNDRREAHQLLDENVIQGNLFPIMEDEITLQRTPIPYKQSAGPTASATSHEALQMIDTHISLKLSPTELVLRSTPPQQPKIRSKKRKQFFDTSTVLTNKFMKRALEDTSDLVREKRNIPSSALDLWRLNNRLRKEAIFSHPSINGLCHALCDIFNGAAPAPAPAPAPVPAPAPALEPVPAPVPVPAPAPDTDSRISHTVDHPASTPNLEMEIEHLPASTSNLEMEIEHLRDREGSDMEDLVASPPRFMSSPRYSEGLGSPSVVAATPGVLSTPDQPLTTGPSNYGQLDAENTTLPDISELMNTTNGEELYFLEADNTPTGSQGTRGTQGVDTLSVRTRAVGRYLRSLSPIKSISDDSTGDLSLNGIVEGKRKKLCARMFYEILVLKSHDLIDVQQDEPYGDIILKLTPNLAKAQI